MSVLKKGKIAIFSLILMLVIAGYINYKYDPLREKKLGQTVYVNSKDGYLYDNVSIYQEDQNAISSSITYENSNLENNTENTKENDSISVFRYDRDNMYSELMDNYNKVILNSSTTTEKVNEYQDKLNKIVEEKNLIAMVENVIKSKGIEDIVIIPSNGENINVIIKSKIEIKEDLMAQIQQILIDQLNVKASKISITCQK